MLVSVRRMAMVRRADRTVVVDQARVVDTGRHGELYGRNVLHRRLRDLRSLASGAASECVAQGLRSGRGGIRATPGSVARIQEAVGSTAIVVAIH